MGKPIFSKTPKLISQTIEGTADQLKSAAHYGTKSAPSQEITQDASPQRPKKTAKSSQNTKATNDKLIADIVSSDSGNKDRLAKRVSVRVTEAQAKALKAYTLKTGKRDADTVRIALELFLASEEFNKAIRE